MVVVVVVMEAEHRKPTHSIETVALVEKHDTWLEHDTAVEEMSERYDGSTGGWAASRFNSSSNDVIGYQTAM